MDRREFVTLSGAAGAAIFAGCLTEDDDSDDEAPAGDDEPSADSLPAEMRTVLSAIPEEVDGRELESLWLIQPDEEIDERSEAYDFVGSVESDIGVAPAAIDVSVIGFYDGLEGSIAIISGSFNGDKIQEDDEAALHSEDGLVVGASEMEKPWPAGRDRAVDLFEDDDGSPREKSELLLSPVSDHEMVTGYFELEAPMMGESVADSIEIWARGTTYVGDMTETVSYSVVFDSEDSVDHEAIEELIDSNDVNRSSDIEFTEDGRRVVATFDQTIEEHRLPDNSPGANFVLRGNDRVLSQSGPESVAAERLDLLVDGEPVTPPWGDSGEIDPGTEFHVDLEPFSFVEIVWNDPEYDDVSHTLGRDVVLVEEPFVVDFDPAANELTVTYSTETTVNAEQLELIREGSEWDSARSGEPLTNYVGETLEPGESFTLDGIAYGDGLHIRYTYETEGYSHTSTVFFESLRPPGSFDLEYSEERLTIEYQGDARSADNYQIRTGDDAAAAVQFGDEYDELTTGDSIELDATYGDEFQVYWMESDQPTLMAAKTIIPDVEFAFEHDESTGEVEVTHDGGIDLDPSSLSFETFPEEAPDIDDSIWQDEYDTVSQGDAVVVELDESIYYLVVEFAGVALSSFSPDRIRGDESEADTASDGDTAVETDQESE